MAPPEAGASAAACARTSCRLATAILVDDRGWLLLQERDEHAPLAPLQWGLVGGHVDPGEEWTDAVWRELWEETGFGPGEAPDLHLWRELETTHAPKRDPRLRDRWQVWIGRTSATDADVRLGEGRQILFVDPQRVRDRDLDLAPGAATVLEQLLASAAYAELCPPTRRAGPAAGSASAGSPP